MREPTRPQEFREISLSGQTRAPVAARRTPIPGRAGAGGAGAAVLAFVAGVLRLCRARPGEVFGSLAALVAVVAVALNALGFQVGRHPAPILPKLALKEAPRTSAGKPVQAASGDPAPAKPVPTKPAPAKDQPAPLAAKGAPAKADSIADILRADETTASVSPKPERAVMQAQRALAKLGYGPLRPDGVMGSTTRAAIERFEKDRKLPVKGEAGGRTLRELAARAGLPPG